MSDRSIVSISNGTIIRFFLIALAFFLVWFLRDLVLIVLTSVVIASFVESTIPYFRKFKIGRVMGIVILYILSILFLAGVFYLFAPLLIIEIYNFSTTLSSYIPGFSFLDYFHSSAFSGAKDIATGLSKNLSIDTLLATSKSFIQNLSGGFFQTLSVAFGNIFNVILITIISFYLSVQDKGIENFLRVILPDRHEDYAVDLWERARKKIALWMKGQMMLGLIVAVLIYLVLSLIGVQYALLLAIIAGIMEFVPYGILVALVPAISFSYVSGGIPTALAVAAVYIIIHQFEVFLFTPLIIKKVVGLSPFVIIIAILTGLELGGFWGVVLAIPSAVLVMEMVSDAEKHKILRKTKNEAK